MDHPKQYLVGYDTHVSAPSRSLLQEATYHPHMTQHSREMMHEARGTGGFTFLDRVKQDLEGRKRRLKVSHTLLGTLLYHYSEMFLLLYTRICLDCVKQG